MRNKKIGIITLHRNVNFGANLQAYASCKYIGSLGYDAQVVDYVPKNKNKFNSVNEWLILSWKNGKNGSVVYKLKLAVALIISAGWKSKRIKAFSSFRKDYMNLTVYCKDKKDISAIDLDAVVCGSDQVWNPEITKGINPIYFGDIPGVPLKISYAASLGRERLDSSDELQLIELIRKMDICSVREEQSREYIHQLTNANVHCVCDPVFLLQKADYEKLVPKRIEKKKYILLYSVVSNVQLTNIAKAYAEQCGLPLIEICSDKKRNTSHKQLSGIGPLEFLNYFRYAETIITNSFHGTAFSIIFEKDFYAVDNKSRGSRMTNLLDKAGLLDRMVENVPDMDLCEIDYTQVRENMALYIADSKEFLKSSLSFSKTSVIDKKCTGCGACYGICHADAISVLQNKEGFLGAYINETKCVNCNLCRQVCPVLNGVECDSFEKEVYAFKANDTIRKTSTSGGAFSALSSIILKNGGSVYAAGPLTKADVKHCRCLNDTDIERARGVKYIQSDFSQCFKQVAEDLRNNMNVMVSGTPCQIAGMKSFVQQMRLPTDNLLLVDIICHGISSPAVFEQFLNWMEKKHRSSVVTYYFRNKELSWRGNSSRAILEDGRIIDNTRELNCFMNTYYSHNITCESCYECPYTSVDRISDITISDYWGIENLDASFEDSLGVSMMIVNSEKGKEYFEKCDGEKCIGSIDTAKQPQLNRPCDRPCERDSFWSEYFNKDIEVLFKKHGGYGNNTLKNKLVFFIKKLKNRSVEGGKFI